MPNNHTWATALHGLTMIRDDATTSDDREASLEALEIEGITLDQLDHIIHGLESICDCSFRNFDYKEN
jgi:hypothetical protein